MLVYRDGAYHPVPSLAPFLTARTGETRALMNATLMREHERLRCRWIGLEILKGVTRLSDGTTVLARSSQVISGQHAELVQCFDDVDPPAGCYHAEHRVLGFADFIRWVYFADSEKQHDFIGIDWSPVEAPRAGVARSMRDVATLSHHLHAAGIPGETELVLLNHRMCESSHLEEWRRETQLWTLKDWTERAHRTLVPHGRYCPCCGAKQHHPNDRFCHQCGLQHPTEE